VLHSQRPSAALVVRALPGRRREAAALAAAVTPALAAAGERDELLERSVERERSLVEGSERRLVRLGFDLHDGPLQDLAALVAETRLLREQLVRAESLDAYRRLLIGRLDDFEARVLTIESELRELVQSLESGTLVHVPFFELIEREISLLSGTSFEVTLETSGEPDALTQSQRIALLRVIQEAVANASEHSGATRAHVAVAVTSSYLHVEVTDDGRGFDVAQTLLDAAKTGRLGLVGMAERIRLLGGRLDVHSRRGGPTKITASIPRWYPQSGTGSS
jgi:signal transduction histidine kinase